MASKMKPRLSKGILEMKFMKRTKEKVAKEDDDAEGRAMYSSEITDKMMQGNSNFIIEPSFVHCENLIEGRLSFRGMNPEIERLLELEQAAKEEKNRPAQEAEVSDKDMAKFYGNPAAYNMNKKFVGKRKSDTMPNGGTRAKFIKPREEED